MILFLSLSVCLHNVFNTHEVKFIFIDLDIILYFSNMMKENARQGFTEKLPSKMARLVSITRQNYKIVLYYCLFFHGWLKA